MKKAKDPAQLSEKKGGLVGFLFPGFPWFLLVSPSFSFCFLVVISGFCLGFPVVLKPQVHKKTGGKPEKTHTKTKERTLTNNPAKNRENDIN